MIKREKIIIGLIILVAVGVLASLGWAGRQIAEKKTEKSIEKIENKNNNQLKNKNSLVTLGEIKFAASKIMNNDRILDTIPLVQNEEIKAYEVVFANKNNIEYEDFKDVVKNYDEFFSLMKKSSGSNADIYNLLTTKAKLYNKNARIFEENFSVLVMSASKDMMPEQYRYKGLPMTYKMKVDAHEDLERIEPEAKIIKEEIFYIQPPFIYYYIETNTGNGYLYNPMFSSLEKIGIKKSIEVKQAPKIKQQTLNKEAREKWFYLLQDYQK